MSEAKPPSSPHIKAAYIGGVFVVIAACVSGVFLLVNTLIDKGFVIVGPGVQVGNPAGEPPSSQPIQTGRNNSQNFLTQADISSLFEEGNWFCFPDRDNAIGVKRLPPGIIVNSPLSKVDTDVREYQIGETPRGLSATAWLERSLPQSECPSIQQDALYKWASVQLTDTEPFNQARLDRLFGAGNWECLSDFAFGVKVFDLSPSFSVQYPFTAIDNSYGKYGVGETVSQRGAATVWLGGTIPRDECP